MKNTQKEKSCTRKTITCSRCKKEKIHFGNGMCSACLRRTKRETKPRFYIGTCYSEMSICKRNGKVKEHKIWQ